MDSYDEAVSRVARAWTEPGSHPLHHRAAQASLRRNWPVLAEAVATLATEHAMRERKAARDGR